MVVKVEISQGGKKVTADAVVTVEQPTYPVGAPIPDVGLVEISTFNPTELIPGPRGSLWFTGPGAPSDGPDFAEGDMHLDDTTDQVWRWTSGAWVNTGTDLTGQQGPPGVDGSPDTPAQILAKLVTVDGAGSGLDADTLDGLDSLYFASAASLAAETTNRTNADTALQTNINGKVAKAGDTMTGGLVTVASSTGGAGLNLPHGAAPSAPVNGDIWTTTTNLSWRQNGATYNAMNLNGSQQVSGVKTFTAEPIMPVPAAGGASIRLPHGVAPTAPVDGDLWTTSAGMYVRVSGGTVGPIGAPPDLSAYAPLASPVFTGNPTAPTPSPGDSDTSIATTAFVSAAMASAGAPDIEVNTYTYNSSTTVPVASGDMALGELRADNASVFSITKIWVSNYDNRTPNRNVTPYYRTVISPGGFISFYTTPTSRHTYRVVSHTLGAAWAEFTVVWVNSVGSLPANGASVYFTAMGGGGAGTTISDTAPSSPSPGQLWWESDTGRLFIWYDDGNTQQWVQLNGAGGGVLGEAPQDGGEYVRVNGVWRLKQQSFTAITNGININVPAGAQLAKFSGKLWAATAVNTAAVMRLSADGSTFVGGATDYVLSGTNFYGGSTASPAKQAHTTSTGWTLGPTTSQVGAPIMFEGQLIVAKNNTGQLFGFQNRGWAFENNATLYMYGYEWNGYTAAAALNAINNIPLFQIIPVGGGTYAAGSMISVEWIY